MDPTVREPPLEEISIADASFDLHWVERQVETIEGGDVCIGISLSPSISDWFQQNPGSRDVRTADLSDVVLDAASSVLIKSGCKILETRYLLEDKDYKKMGIRQKALHFVRSNKVIIIGFNLGYRNYYHWITECLPAIAASVMQVGPQRCALALPPLYDWQEESLTMLGLAGIPRILIDLSCQYHCRHVHYCEFLNGKTSFYLSPRTLEVIGKLSVDVEPSDDNHALLYVARFDSHNRMVTNEREVEHLLHANGFATVIPSSLSLREQISLFKAARIVVGAHGAGMTNIAFCKPGTTVLELIQSSYANPCFTRIAQVGRLEYHAECFQRASNEDVREQAWSIDTERLAAKLMRLLI